MKRQTNRLSLRDIRNAGASKTHAGSKLYPDGGGLYLQVTSAGVKSWIFRYTQDGQAKSIGLGPLHTVSVADAREEALKCRKLVLMGLDPKNEKEKEKISRTISRQRTFRSCAETFIQEIAPEHTNAKAHEQWYSSLREYAYPVIGDVPISDIDVHMIRAMMLRNNAWQEKTDTIARVRGRVERILNWAAVLGMRSTDNPARFKNFLSEVLPSRRSIRTVRHHSALPYALIPGFIATLHSQPKSVSALALEFLILTAARTGEVIGARWVEICEEEKVWRVPASRMKARQPHVVPLCGRALEILRELKEGMESPFIFRGVKMGTHISNMAMLQYMKRLTEKGLLTVPAVPHGMRAAARTWLAEKTSYPRELAEAALAHAMGKVEAAYNRGSALERRRQMMNDWAAFCEGKIVDALGPKPHPSEMTH